MSQTSATIPAQPPKPLIFALSIIGFFTLLHWLILTLRLPVFTALPYWFYDFKEQTVQLLWIGVAVAILALATLISFSNVSYSRKLLLLVVLGTSIQFSMAFSQGKGLAGMRDRIVNTGHAEFAVIAVQQNSMLDTAKYYEPKVANGELGDYAPSKPPGTLLFYMLCERVANGLQKNLLPAQRLENLRTFASLIWPLISYIVLVPMFILGRSVFDKPAALTAGLLYITIPSVNLITLHLDQVLFPLLAVLPVALIVSSCAQRNNWLALLAGITLYLAVYCSFGLVPVILLVLAALVFMYLEHPSKNWPSALQLFGAMLAGMILLDILMRLFLNYDIVTRYLAASEYHANWKGWEGGPSVLLNAGLTNTVEFLVWLGLPIGVLLVGGVGYWFKHMFISKIVSRPVAFSAALIGVFSLLLLFGHTKAETARLWMFLIPFICIFVAGFIHTAMLPHKNQRITLVSLVVALEFGTTYLTLRYQNFW